MKKLIAVLLTVVMLWGCGGDPSTTEDNGAATAPTEEVNPMQNDLTERFVNAPGDALPAEYTYVIKGGDIPEHSNGDLVLLSMEVKSDSGVKTLGVNFYQGGTECAEEYYVPTQWTRIVLCSDPTTNPVGIKLTAQEGIALRKLTLESVGKVTPEEVGHRLGQFVVDDFQRVELPETGAGVGRTTDLVKSGDYVYSIGQGVFTVTDVRDPNAPKVCGTIDGLGNTRQIALLESGTDVMVTARGYGAYIIDAKDPNAPRIRCTYDTVEMGTGICISGQYAYISNRQYGVEIVDLKDPDHPKYVRTVSTGEVQSTQVYGDRMYCGLYGEHRVDIYDLSAQEPQKLGEVALSGRGDGLAVAEQDGRIYLYAATGHHSQKSLTRETPLTDPRYGQGNGMDIVDVTDPQNPIRLSTVRCDGRFYHSSYDFWEAHVSESDGHRYAHVVGTYNGLYIYNVDDPRNPVRVAHITVPIPQKSKNYSMYKSSIRTLVFPFDKFKTIQTPFGAMVCDDGTLYMAGVLTDLHILPMDSVGDGLQPAQKALKIPDFIPDGGARFDPAGQVHAVISDGKQLILACGNEGIATVTPELTLKVQYPTKGTCYDVQLFDGVLYSAEGRAGLAAYDAGSMEELWRYDPKEKVIKQVRLSPKGRFAVLHSGDTEASVVRLSDLTEVYKKRTGSQMYHHNVSSTLIGGRYLCFWANATNEVWLDFGPEDDWASPTVTEYVSRTAMQGGVVDCKGKALNMTGKGYLLYDPATDPAGVEPLAPVAGFTGKPTVYGDLLIVTNRVTGKVCFANISDPGRPTSKGETFVAGNPDIAIVAFGAVYIPCGNAGLIRVPLP